MRQEITNEITRNIISLWEEKNLSVSEIAAAVGLNTKQVIAIVYNLRKHGIALGKKNRTGVYTEEYIQSLKDYLSLVREKLSQNVQKKKGSAK